MLAAEYGPALMDAASAVQSLFSGKKSKKNRFLIFFVSEFIEGGKFLKATPPISNETRILKIKKAIVRVPTISNEKRMFKILELGV